MIWGSGIRGFLKITSPCSEESFGREPERPSFRFFSFSPLYFLNQEEDPFLLRPWAFSPKEHSVPFARARVPHKRNATDAAPAVQASSLPPLPESSPPRPTPRIDLFALSYKYLEFLSCI